MKFASGGCRDAFHCGGISGLEGKFVLKKYREEKKNDINVMFESLEKHTRKVVQMHSLASNFAKKLRDEATRMFGSTFMYTKL